ncbi:MAG: peptide chain release factor 2 [Deltaproteobacteria bacterium]|nr:peptide chain release factor 2 [Deltaproteobacteria bacterium]
MLREDREKLNDLTRRLEELRRYLDVEGKSERLAEIDAESGKADFWNDAEKAQELSRERNALDKTVTSWRGLSRQMEDLEVLGELLEEEDDPGALKEFHELLSRSEVGIAKMEFNRMLSGEYDGNDAILSINAGAGGTEAQDWAEMLLRMYLRFCEKKGFATEITDCLAGEEAGIKSVTLTVSGDYAYGWMRPEIGIHRLVRISPFDSNARRHTSFCSVFVFPDLPDDVTVEINEKDLRIDTYRSTGAGGQHVNKTDSAVRITHIPTGVVVSCQNERSQHKNKSTAMHQLRAILYQRELARKEEEAAKFSADKKEIGWGSQIRSYVLHPYRLVKDHRTGYEVGNADAVLDGDLEGFIEAYLLGRQKNQG